MFDHVLLVLLLLADGLCWYEARRSGNVMKLYFVERRKWYEARSKKTEPEKSGTNKNTASPVPSTIKSEKNKDGAVAPAGDLLPISPFPSK